MVGKCVVNPQDETPLLGFPARCGGKGDRRTGGEGGCLEENTGFPAIRGSSTDRLELRCAPTGGHAEEGKDFGDRYLARVGNGWVRGREFLARLTLVWYSTIPALGRPAWVGRVSHLLPAPVPYPGYGCAESDYDPGETTTTNPSSNLPPPVYLPRIQLRRNGSLGGFFLGFRNAVASQWDPYLPIVSFASVRFWTYDEEAEEKTKRNIRQPEKKSVSRCE